MAGISGKVIGERIHKYLTNDKKVDFSKCKNSDNMEECKIKVYEDLIQGLRKNESYCSKSKNPEQCKKYVNQQIKKYEQNIVNLKGLK